MADKKKKNIKKGKPVVSKKAKNPAKKSIKKVAFKKAPSLKSKKIKPVKITAKVKKKTGKSKKILPLSSEGVDVNNFFKAKIKVIGIGGGGSSIVSEIGRSLHKANFIIADTDSRSFKKRPKIKYFLFGQELTHGLGTGLNTELAKKAAEMEKEKIAKLFENQDIIILVASLGGGSGVSSHPDFCRGLKKL